MRCISSIGDKQLQVDKPLPVSTFSHPCAYCPQSCASTLLSVLYTLKGDQSLDPVCTSLSALRTFAMLCILSCVSCWQVPRRTRSSLCAFSAISVHEECATVSCSTCTNQFWVTQHVGVLPSNCLYLQHRARTCLSVPTQESVYSVGAEMAELIDS